MFIEEKKEMKKLVLFILIVFIAGYTVTDFPKEEVITYHYTVKAGDNLYDIAKDIVKENEDVRELVYQIKKDNNISDVGNLQAGDELIIHVKSH
jgi:hypothetical protein